MQKKINDTDIELIKNLYFNNNYSQHKIAEYFNVSQGTIHNFFVEHNIQSRDKTSHMRKYSLNECYFDDIDSDDKAYFLGLLYADGNVDKNSYGIHIELQERDKYILEYFNQCIESDKPLIFRKFDKGFNSYKLSIHSKHMHYILTNKYGLVPNKSLVLEFPINIPDKYMLSMLRGYIDGDGWIQKYRIAFMSSDKFCNGIHDYLLKNFNINSTVRDQNPNKYSPNTKVLDITGRKNIISLVSKMFHTNNCICLPRKFSKYKDYNFININNSLIA